MRGLPVAGKSGMHRFMASRCNTTLPCLLLTLALLILCHPLCAGETPVIPEDAIVALKADRTAAPTHRLDDIIGRVVEHQRGEGLTRG